MSTFQQIIGNGLTALTCVAGVEVKYRRGADWVRIRAVPGQTTFNITDANVVVSETRSRDYLIQADDLVIGGVVVTPQRGDLIEETVGAKIQIYEVTRPDGEQPWRYADHGRTSIRVHTKLKAVQ
jgi:hypothetical protein